MSIFLNSDSVRELWTIIAGPKVSGKLWLDPRVFEEKPVAQVGRLIFCIEGEVGQHKAPHFHIRIRKNRLASVAIHDGIAFHSKLSTQEDNSIRAWTLRHRKGLMAAWNAVCAGGEPIFIVCDTFGCNCKVR